ncbi:MAG: helix-turn-helix domain-containing protein, partial [Xanthobacteraceae bacterium]
RLLLNMTQTELGDTVGITFQQIQKYEKGANRISASRLQQFSSILHVPAAFFFEGAPEEKSGARVTEDRSTNEFMEFLSTSEGLAVAKAFMSIKSSSLRRTLASTVEKIAEECDRPRSLRKS